jgi:hypothetical protein
MQRRPPSPHQAELARIRAAGRAQRDLQALDLHAKYMGMPARFSDESGSEYMDRLRRHAARPIAEGRT